MHMLSGCSRRTAMRIDRLAANQHHRAQRCLSFGFQIVGNFNKPLKVFLLLIWKKEIGKVLNRGSGTLLHGTCSNKPSYTKLNLHISKTLYGLKSKFM